mgnify:FL=1
MMPELYNPVKRKLLEGRKVVGGLIHTTDPEIYCAMARAGFDFLWVEMQHSPLTYQDVARMIRAAQGLEAVPFIRVPDATESDIQKATDIGALGIIVPMVDSPEKIRAAISFAKYPPEGRRSYGNAQAAWLWGERYRQTANENLMVVAMIETPEGVAAASQIAAVPGVDVIFAASYDLSSFSGLPPGHPEYEAMVDQIRSATLEAGKVLGGPLAWRERPGFRFFHGPPEAEIIAAGARSLLG